MTRRTRALNGEQERCRRFLIERSCALLSIGRCSLKHVTFLSLLMTLLAAMSAPETVTAKEANSCGGKDLLAELHDSDPEAAQRVLAEASKVANDGAVLWRISREGLTDSFLFGTVHMTDERVTNLPERVRNAIEGARVVALEVADVAPTALATAISKTPTLMMFEDGRRLDLLISPEAFIKVKAQLKAARLPSAFAEHFKPWVISMVMAVTDCERERLTGGKPVVDMRIADIARAKDIPVVGLETVEAQLAAAASVPMEEQVAILRSSLKLADRAEDLRETILQLYLSRKIGAALPLQKLLAERSGIEGVTFEGFKSLMVDGRNRAMRTRALPLIAEGNVFIAVGALHLIGENGLVALLRNAGYRVDPVE